MTDEPQQTKLKVVKDEPKAISLPSPNLEHASVFENELQNRLHGFRSGIVALQGELEGQQEQYRKSVDKLTTEHEEAKAGLLRRIGDLQRAEAMASAALDVRSTTPSQDG